MFGELIGVGLADLLDPRRAAGETPLCRAWPGPRHARRGCAAGDARRRARARRRISSRPARSLRARPGGAARRRRDGTTSSRPCPRTARCCSSPTNSSTPCRSASWIAPRRLEELRRHLRRTSVSSAVAGRDRGRDPSDRIARRESIETSPASLPASAGSPIAAQGGVALIVDYGHDRLGSRRHAAGGVAATLYADPWTAPGEHDLTAHVDFEALAEAPRRRRRPHLSGRSAQGDWLDATGDRRCAPRSLAKAAPERAEEIAAARDRLISPDRRWAGCSR